MADGTLIEWAAVPGCRRVSPGCQGCHAERVARRQILMARAQGRTSLYEGTVRACDACGGSCTACKGTGLGRGWSGQVGLDIGVLEQALRWREPRAVFLESTGDLFYDAVPEDFLVQVFDVLRRNELRARPHLFLVLTKRPERMAELAGALRWDPVGRGGKGYVGRDADGRPLATLLRHVWWGTSVEDQPRADERIPTLFEVPKHPRSVFFVSLEPLLGSVNLCRVGDSVSDGMWSIDALRGFLFVEGRNEPTPCPRLDWVIAGAESGTGARPCDVAWIRDVVGQCVDAGTACFVKQLGARPVLNARPAREPLAPELAGRFGVSVDAVYAFRDRKGANPAEWPEDLRVREWPRVLEAVR